MGLKMAFSAIIKVFFSCTRKLRLVLQFEGKKVVLQSLCLPDEGLKKGFNWQFFTAKGRLAVN